MNNGENPEDIFAGQLADPSVCRACGPGNRSAEFLCIKCGYGICHRHCKSDVSGRKHTCADGCSAKAMQMLGTIKEADMVIMADLEREDEDDHEQLLRLS